MEYGIQPGQAHDDSGGSPMWPWIWRIERIEHLPADDGQWICRAILYHQRATEAVEWVAKHLDARIVIGTLVTIKSSGNALSVGGRRRVARLAPILRAEAEVNLFELVPHPWVRDRDLVRRAAELWLLLPTGFRRLFNSLLWEPRRFQRYVMGPSSVNNHHNVINGNFRHSVEVAEWALLLGQGNARVCMPILILGALIHDAGKADEYRFNRARNCFEMSEPGTLCGHRDRLQQWLGAAIERCPGAIPDVAYLGLVHALTAAKGAAPHLGLREPRSLEAMILSIADRLSGSGEMFDRLTPIEGGFGAYHPHLNGRLYVVGRCTD